MKKHYIWIAAGQLGNQLFQYQAALHFSKNNRLICVGATMFRYFKPQQNHIKLPFLREKMESLVQFLAKKKWISVLTPDRVPSNVSSESSEGKTYTLFPGKWSEITHLKGYFQHSDFLEPKPQFKDSILKQAQTLLAFLPQNLPKIFIHYREGDYKEWSILGHSGTVLSQSYYVQSIQLMKEQFPDATYVILSDQKKVQTPWMSLLDRVVFLHHSPGVDMAIMSLCDHAILSASSFSWWGAALISTPQKFVIGPQYWLGFKSNEWFPDSIKNDDWIHFIPINETES